MSDNTNLIPEGFPDDGLDEFTRAYIECALWSETDNATENGGEPLDKNYSIEDVAPEAIARMSADCAKFQQECASLLDYAEYKHDKHYSLELAGHDFWLTRNGHGAGFWDRDLAEVGEALTDATEKFGECNLYVGDDGKIYVS